MEVGMSRPKTDWQQMDKTRETENENAGGKTPGGGTSMTYFKRIGNRQDILEKKEEALYPTVRRNACLSK